MRSLKVLVLEDSPFQLMAIHQMLNASGVFDVLTAETVAGGRDSLSRRGPVDIAICDLQMEEGDGQDMIDHLATHRLARAVIILSCTGLPRLEAAASRSRLQGLPVLAALQKPASVKVLHALLEAYTATWRASAASLPLVQVEELRAWPLGVSA